MNVLDAAVITDAVASAGPAGDDARQLLAQESWLHVPAIVTAEVTSALRDMLRRAAIDVLVAQHAATSACQLRMRQYSFELFLDRAWDP